MRVVLCDEDALLREMEEALITRLGHEIVGIADTTVDGVHLIQAARPDVVVFDLSLGYNTDFDVIDSALGVGAQIIVFSHNADEAILSRYARRPIVVPKPDLVGLEQVLSRLEVDHTQGTVVEHDRRRRPARAAGGSVPTSVADAQAFYEAINDAHPGDAMVSIEVPGDATAVGEDLLGVMRATDRLLAWSTGVRVFLIDGGDGGTDAFLRRVAEAAVLPPAGARITAIVVGAEETPMEAFERLKHGGGDRTL